MNATAMPGLEREARSSTLARAAAERPTACGVEVLLRGRIIDSWVEPAGTCDWNSRVVLQVAPKGRPRELVILEAEAALVPDLGWLADLGENLCHGSPVSVRARLTGDGLSATQLRLDR